MAKYRKLPVVIEAERFYRLDPWPEGVELNDDEEYVIETLEGNMKVSEGDFIITGVAGEKYPCKPDIFKATYELVEED